MNQPFTINYDVFKFSGGVMYDIIENMFCGVDKIIKIEYTKNGVPLLASWMIDDAAERIVMAVCPENFRSQIDATDLRKLLKSLDGWHYTGQYLSSNGTLLGAAVFKGGNIAVVDEARQKDEMITVKPNTILIDRGLYKAECEHIFRFTLAHEIGHALMHRKFCMTEENMKRYAEGSRQRFLMDAESRFEIRDRKKLQSDYDWLEWQANAFASAVLMPNSLVRKVAAMVREGYSSEIEYYNELNITLMDVFRVSEVAAFYRMKELKIVPPQAKRVNNGVIVV